MTTQEFVEKHGIGIKSTKALSNPNMDEDPKYPMDHWQVRLHYSGRHDQDGHMDLHYSKGLGHREHPRGIKALDPRPVPPSAVEVLDCLRSDAGALDLTFCDWVDDMGYEDPKTAYRTWEACREQAEDLRAMFSFRDRKNPQGFIVHGDTWNEFLDTEEE